MKNKRIRTLVTLVCSGIICIAGARIFILTHRAHHLASWMGPEAPPISRNPAAIHRIQSICQNVYQAVCQKSGDALDPTGTVRPDIEGEKQAIHIYQDIIHQHRNWTREQVEEELVQQIFDVKRKNRIESAFQWVNASIRKLIDRQPASVFKNEEKEFIKARIKKTQLQLPFPASVYADEPDLLTKNEVYYERLIDGQLRLRVGGAYVLIAKSWFNLVFTLAHELAHSIDPCEIRSAGLSFKAYENLTACFTQNNLIPPKRTQCGPNDHLSETFADWMAVQVTIDALKHFATEFQGTQIVNAIRNSVRDLCEQEEAEPEDFSGGPHPSPQTRINQIFGPPIRTFLECIPDQTTSNYCSFESVPLEPLNPETSPL